MSASNRRPPQLPTDDEITQAKEASRQLARMLPEGQLPLRLVTENNRHEMISIPPGAVRLFMDVLTQLGQGRGVTILPEKVELTTQEVADYLNVSRPYVVKLIDSGKLAARMVGTRRRVAIEDLVRFDQEDRKLRRAALDEMARLDHAMEL
jgi:excisionase family DNA binding protein